jgi:hypothetical protein
VKFDVVGTVANSDVAEPYFDAPNDSKTDWKYQMDVC